MKPAQVIQILSGYFHFDRTACFAAARKNREQLCNRKLRLAIEPRTKQEEKRERDGRSAEDFASAVLQLSGHTND